MPLLATFREDFKTHVVKTYWLIENSQNNIILKGSQHQKLYLTLRPVRVEFVVYFGSPQTPAPSHASHNRRRPTYVPTYLAHHGHCHARIYMLITT
jgi:hypothetical protein